MSAEMSGSFIVTSNVTDTETKLSDECNEESLITFDGQNDNTTTTTESVPTSIQNHINNVSDDDKQHKHHHLKESLYATPLPKSDRPKIKPTTVGNDESKMRAFEDAKPSAAGSEDRHILNFLKDTSKLQRKLSRGGNGSGGNSSGDSEYGRSGFSSLAQEQHFVNLVQQNVIGYSDNNTKEQDSTDEEINKINGDESAVDKRKLSNQVAERMKVGMEPVVSVFIKREWIIKMIAMCLEQRCSKNSTKLPVIPTEDFSDATGDSSKKLIGASRMQSKQTTQYTGVMLLGSNGSGKTTVCQQILNGNTGTQGILNRKLLCCYFISSQNSECHNLSTFLRCIIMQVLSHSTFFSGKDEHENPNKSKEENVEDLANTPVNGAKIEQESIISVEEKNAQKNQILRQHSELDSQAALNSNGKSNRDSSYGTYPPSKGPESAPIEDDQCSKTNKNKIKTISSKIPVKIGHKSQALPSLPSNKNTSGENATKQTDEQHQRDKDEPEVKYENIEIERGKEATPDVTQPIGSERQESDQPQPPPKTKSCLQMVADEYYTILQENPEILDSLNADNIEKNPDECFKKAILFPFLEIQPPKTALLFVVDSIDEHYINEEGNVMATLKGSTTNRSRSIAELLSNNFHLLPKWLFLVCTAKRQNRHIVKRFNGFKKIALDDLRKSHVVKDVQEYIISRLNSDFKGVIHFTADIIECLNQLYIKSNGSVLYLEKVLSGVRESVFSFREIKLIPCTLNGLYLYICQKSFNKKQYSKIRPILNILLACSDFVELSFVYNCLRTMNYTIDQPEFDKRIEVMRYIIAFNDEKTKIKMFHSSFSDWLSDVKFSTKKFLCNVNEGHAMIAMYYTVVSETLCPNQVLKYFHHLIKCDECAITKGINLDLILILLESRANLVDCFYTNSLNCCPTCELEYKTAFCSMPKMRTMIERYLNKTLNENVLNFLGDFYKPSLPTNTKILKLLIETGINNADCQLSYDSLLNSPVVEENNDELAELLLTSERSCQQDNSKLKVKEGEQNSEYQEIGSPASSPLNQMNPQQQSADELLQQHQLLVRGKAFIHLLANEGNISLLERALKACKKDGNDVACIDLEIEDECGQTALNIAARNGHYDIVKLLLSLRYTTSKSGSQKIQHVNVNHADRDGWTPLRSASWGGHTEVVKLLIQHPNIQIDLADKEQRTALRAAAWSGHEDILKTLINAGADVNSVDRQGRTSLIAASYMGHYEIVEILLENGADVNHLDIDGRSALCVAALCGSSGYSKVISILLDYHANTDQQDNDGMSPLLVSAFEGNTEVCELLLENGADPDLCDNMGRTPLWAACTTGHANIAKLLLFWGCSIDCMDSEGRTVLSIAAAQGSILPLN